MPELNIINPTLSDILSTTDPNGNIAPFIEIAEKMNPIIEDAVYEECNDGSTHRHVIRTGLPTPAFRRYNQGVQPSKSTGMPVQDTTGMIEDYLEVDKALADLKGRAKAYRSNQSIGKIQGFNNFVAQNMFYGSTVATPEGFMGLSPRFADTSVASGRQIIDGGGRGATNTSVWFVTWGGNGCKLIYPEGSAAGFQHRDLGESTKEMGGGRLMQVYRDHYKWDLGMALGDWRSCARIANIDVTALTKDASSGADLLDLMIDGEEMIDTAATISVNTEGQLVEGKTCVYVSRTIAKFLRKQALNKANVNLTVETVAGKRVTMWGEYPVRRIDSLLETEEAVSFA